MINETDLSSKFVDETIREFGSRIWIQKQQDPLRRGTPDIYSIFDGMFIPIECKKVVNNGCSILEHPFTKIQRKRFKDFIVVQAFPIGLIFCGREEKRYVFPLAIREDGNMSYDQYIKLPIFNWLEIRDAATKNYISRFGRK